MPSYAILHNYRNKVTVLNMFTTPEIHEEQDKQITTNKNPHKQQNEVT